MECIFCDIINRKAEAEILFENEDIISFLDIRPVNYGHTLVIPKAHFENFLSLPEDMLLELTKTTQTLADAILKSLKPEGFNIVVNTGVAAGQSVFHFHYHIIPRFKDDNFGFRPNLKKYNNGSMHEYAEKIRAAVIK